MSGADTECQLPGTSSTALPLVLELVDATVPFGVAVVPPQAVGREKVPVVQSSLWEGFLVAAPAVTVSLRQAAVTGGAAQNQRGALGDSSLNS